MKKNSKIVSVLAVFFAVMTLSSCMNAIMGSIMGMYYFEDGVYELVLTESSSSAGASIIYMNKDTGDSVDYIYDAGDVTFKVGNVYVLDKGYEVAIISKKDVTVTDPTGNLSRTLKRGDVTKWAMSKK